MSNPSVIWAQLATPFPAAGSVPFVDSDNATIVTDVQNFYYDPVAKKLHIQTNGVYSQGGAVNINGYYTAYSANGARPAFGYGVLASRGTEASPLISGGADGIGSIFAQAYTGLAPSYQTIATINFYTQGSNAPTNLGVGGSIRIATQPDGVGTGPVEWLEFTQGGDIITLQTGVSLGKPQALVAGGVQNTGCFASAYFNYFISSVAQVGSVTCNGARMGKCKIAGGTNTFTVTNNIVTTNSIIHVQIETLDNTAKTAIVVPGNGSFVVTTNANATGTTWINWIIWGTDL